MSSSDDEQLPPAANGGGAMSAGGSELPPAGFLDLPSELLVRVMTHLLEAKCPDAADEGVAHPQPTEPTPVTQIGRRMWRRHAGMASVCRAFRSAFLHAILSLDVDLSSGLDTLQPERRTAAVVRRGTGLAVTLGRMVALRELTLLLAGIPEPWAVPVVSDLLFGVLGHAALPPTLRYLRVHCDVLPLHSLCALLAGQPQLAELVLHCEDKTVLRPSEVALLASLYGRLAPRLVALDLQPLFGVLGLDTERAFVAFFRQLPVLSKVRFVDLDYCVPSRCCVLMATARTLTAVSRCCPAVVTLCVGSLSPELNSEAGAATLLGLFPKLTSLSLAAAGGGCDRVVSPPLIAALCLERSLNTLCLPFVNTVEAAMTPSLLGDALLAGNKPPMNLRLDQTLTSFPIVALLSGGLRGLRGLHLSDVEDLDVPSCRALASCPTLQVLELGCLADSALPLGLEHTSALATAPALIRLYLTRVALVGAAAAGLVTTLSRKTPQTLTGLYMSECHGEIESAILAMVHVRSARELVITHHGRATGAPPLGDDSADEEAAVGMDHSVAVDYLARYRPDIRFYSKF
ncbi:hypothetical protein BU14_0014s0050 [Porphyra umbilicalis]|uniref:Uncharacterized protein n=1 Tax=Porphyra umbilicalis TaxID=2786 RepID=A0A1X6PL15_PORUM|nr:hypothetical protein BU14_0014s0050 [Porphyra umbilicalis]|eukprot:OSX81500.1 hypothetical protein BU14_0014s0050 [Porphyra umbilicalis]